MEPETRWDAIVRRRPQRPRHRPPLVVVLITVVLMFAWVAVSDRYLFAALYPWSALVLAARLSPDLDPWVFLAACCVTWPVYLEIWCRVVRKGGSTRRTAARIAAVHAAAALAAGLALLLRASAGS